jgi:fatty-acyl-CoA synthase
VAAFVVPHDRVLDTKRVRDFCRERLADYQCPTRVEIITELPRNALGKVLKRELESVIGGRRQEGDSARRS